VSERGAGGYPPRHGMRASNDGTAAVARGARARLLRILLAVSVWVALGPARAASSQGIERAAIERGPATARAILTDEETQTELPDIGPPVGARHTDDSLQDRILRYALAPIATALLWGGLVLSLALGLVWLFRSLREARTDRGEDEGRARAPSAGAPVLDARVLADAESLAAEGRYAEAIHALLLRVLEALGRDDPGRVRRSMTSREIAAALPLAPAPRAALGALVAEVERSLFGGSMPGRPEYEACLRGYGVLEAASGSAA